MQVAGPFTPVVLLIGALGAKIWLPAPLGLWEKASVPTGILHPALGSSQLQGEGVESGVPGSVSAAMGSRCFSPPRTHQGRRVPG